MTTAPQPRHATNEGSDVSSGALAELRAAAAILRRLAGKAAEGPWRYSAGSHRDDFDKAEVITENGGWIIATSHAVNDDSFRWIAAMSPVVAKPLAGLLTEAANDIEDNGAHPFKYGHAIAFARAALGGQS